MNIKVRKKILVVKKHESNPKAEYITQCSVIGNNIRENRKQRRITVEELAGLLDLSESYIGLLERGDRCPSLKIVYKLCAIYGISPTDLLTSKGHSLYETENSTTAQIKTITSIANTFSEIELEFVIETMKNLRKITNQVI